MFGLDGVANSVGMEAEFASDGADLPVFGVKVATDLDTGFRTDHRGLSSARRKAWKGIEETAAAATDRATQFVTGPVFRPAPGEDRGGASPERRPSRSRIPLPHVDRGSDRKGTLIRHADVLSPAPPVFPLAVAMVKPSFRAPLMPAVGAAPLLQPGLVAASRAAIALAAIAVLTDPEHRLASPAAANSLTENRFAMDRHPRRQAGLDNGSQSWQGQDIHSMATCFGLPTGTPPLPTAGSHCRSRLRGETVHHRRADRMIDG